MHGIPRGKRKLINRENMLQQIILILIIIACVVWAFFFSENLLLKVLSGISVAIVGTIIFTYVILDFLSGRGYQIASALNELVYLVIGIPLLVIAAGFLPASILIAFFFDSASITWFLPFIYILIGILEILSIAFLINRYLRDKNMSLFQYIRYIFDFETRAKENRKMRERTEQIDNFYEDLHRVEDRIAQKIEKRSRGFEHFDWKERVGQVSGKNKNEIKCWNCQALNERDSSFCSDCSAPLRKEVSK